MTPHNLHVDSVKDGRSSTKDRQWLKKVIYWLDEVQ